VKISADTHEVLVPHGCGFVLVQLTIVYDRPGRWEHRPLLEWSVSLLSQRARLSEKCEVTLSVTEIILHMLSQRPAVLGSP